MRLTDFAELSLKNTLNMSSSEFDLKGLAGFRENRQTVAGDFKKAGIGGKGVFDFIPSAPQTCCDRAGYNRLAGVNGEGRGVDLCRPPEDLAAQTPFDDP